MVYLMSNVFVQNWHIVANYDVLTKLWVQQQILCNIRPNSFDLILGECHTKSSCLINVQAKLTSMKIEYRQYIGVDFTNEDIQYKSYSLRKLIFCIFWEIYKNFNLPILFSYYKL